MPSKENLRYGPNFGRILAVLCVAALLPGCGCEDVEEVNRPPVADAGPDLGGVVGEPVEIEGSGTDPDGDPLTFRWTLHERPAGSLAELDGDSHATVTLTPDVEGEYFLGLVVNDGELDSDEDTMTLTAEAPELIHGRITVRVVDGRDGEPIAGALVELGSGQAGETDAGGSVDITEPGLEGPVDVYVSHPDAITGPGGETIPRWRGATVVGALRSEITVPLNITYTPPAVERGRVRGHVHETLLEALPEVGPVIPFTAAPCDVDDFETEWEDCDRYLLERVGSGQLRAFVITPLTDKKPLALDVSDLLGAPASEDSPLPGNLVSNDGFLASLSSVIGIPPAPDGYPGLTWFDLELPAGKHDLLVLGVLITVDTEVLWTLVDRAQAGDPVDPGAVLGTMKLETLLVGLIEVDVPGDGEILFDDTPDNLEPGGLTLDDLDEVYFVPAQIEMRQAMRPYAMDPQVEAQMRWAEVSFESPGVVSAQGLLEDPRLESHVPDRTRVRVGDDWVWMDVPEETGVPETHVPYALVAAVAETERGLLPLGLAFTRAGAQSIPEASFGLPRREGLFDGAPIQAVGFTARGVGPTGQDGAWGLLPGQAVARRHISSDGVSALADPVAFPWLLEPEDAGLWVDLLLDRPDRHSTEVTRASAYMIDLLDPDPDVHVLGDTMELSVTGEAHLAQVILHRRDEVEEGVPVDVPLWDIYMEAGAGLAVTVPEAARAALEGGQVRIDVLASSWSSPLDMERWSGERVRTGPLTYTRDTWLAVMP